MSIYTWTEKETSNSTIERKLIKSFKDSLGDTLKESDLVLINELMDWLKISSKAKKDLQKSVK